MIPNGRQDVNQADIDAVTAVLRSDFLTQGPAVPRFENEVAAYCGARYAVAANSATAALHLACLALGVGKGDRVWTSPITFVASANCALYCGATVDFVDIDPRTYLFSVSSLERKLAEAEKSGTLPKVVIPVHLCGQPCDMERIHALGRRYGFKIIEDASHAIGGRYKNEPIGNCRYSDICVFSFHPVKIVTTGEGGMSLTNDEGLAARMARLRSHGITRDAAEMTEVSHGPWYYQQLELGYNYRMTDIHAALGLSQLARLDEFVARRREIARRYDEAFVGLPLRTPWQHVDGHSSYHLYVVRLDSGVLDHSRVFESMLASGIGVNLHYIPVYAHPYHKRSGMSAMEFPESERYYREAMSLPIFPTLAPAQQDEVVHALGSAVGSCRRA